MNKACLFGGAIFAAGIALHAEADPEIVFSNSFVFAALEPSSAYGFHTGAGPWMIGGVDGDSYAYSYGGALGISARAYSAVAGPPAVAFVDLSYAFFTVTEDVLADIAWDLTASDAGVTGWYLNDGTNNVVLAGWNGTPGTTQVLLEAGNQYQFSANLSTRTPFGNGGPFVSLQLVPTPATTGLLAMGGLLAARRRR